MNASTRNTLTAGFANPEPDVARPPMGRKPGTFSLDAAVKDLEVGAVASTTKRMDQTQAYNDVVAAAEAARQAVRNTLGKAAHRAKAATGGEYTVEVVDCLTTARNWFVVGLITRIS